MPRDVPGSRFSLSLDARDARPPRRAGKGTGVGEVEEEEEEEEEGEEEEAEEEGEEEGGEGNGPIGSFARRSVSRNRDNRSSQLREQGAACSNIITATCPPVRYLVTKFVPRKFTVYSR